MNKVMLIGNVGADPVIRCFDNGNMVAKFRMVTTKRMTDKDGNRRELSEWHNVECWDKKASLIDEYVRKGDKLYVEGDLHYEEYTDKDGQKRTMTVIRLQQVEMLTPKPKIEPQATTEPQAQPAQPTQTATPEPPQMPLPPLWDNGLPF